jgi:hypothetical protein
MKNSGIIILLMVLALNSHAYDSRKCGQMVFGGSHPLSMFFATTGSATSFISSTGDCAAIGYHSKENKELFYVNNELELQLDIAKGNGVYLSELVQIYGCENSSYTIKNLMNNYDHIYSNSNPKLVIDNLLRSENCKYL